MASAAPKSLELPPKLKELHWFLEMSGGDVSIESIYNKVFTDTRDRDLRSMQQYIGPYITKLNRRLKQHGAAVKPGRLKGTYALTVL